MTEKIVVNIDDVPLHDRGNGEKFVVEWGRVAPLLGLQGLGCAVHVVPPGKTAFGAKNADFRTPAYAAVGRLTPADYFDGE
jgi:hypothetical protein